MTTPLDWIRDAAGQAPPPVKDGVHTGVDVAEGIIFADGSLPAGTNPADIYSWFHDGPGTPGYEQALAALDTLAGTFPEYTEGVRAAQREVESGWHGEAAEKSVRSFEPLLAASAKLERHATNAGQSVSGQITSFNTTKTRVVPVPADPPVGPGMNQFSQPFAPENYSADAAVAAYQAATYNNQDAYGGYQGQTSPQGTALPQEGADADARRPGDGTDPAPGRPEPPGPAPGDPGPPVRQPPPVGGPPDTGSPGGDQPGDDPPGSPGESGPKPGGSSPPGGAVPPGAQVPGGTDPDRLLPGETDPSQVDPVAPGGRPAVSTPGLPGGTNALSGGSNALPGPGGVPGWSSGGAAEVRSGGRSFGAGARGGGSPSGGFGGAGRSGSAGSSGMGAPAGRGEGDEDHERNSKYVLVTEHESEFVGELPAHSPSVIGEWTRDDDE